MRKCAVQIMKCSVASVTETRTDKRKRETDVTDDSKGDQSLVKKSKDS